MEELIVCCRSRIVSACSVDQNVTCSEICKNRISCCLDALSLKYVTCISFCDSSVFDDRICVCFCCLLIEVKKSNFCSCLSNSCREHRAENSARSCHNYYFIFQINLKWKFHNFPRSNLFIFTNYLSNLSRVSQIPVMYIAPNALSYSPYPGFPVSPQIILP